MHLTIEHIGVDTMKSLRSDLSLKKLKFKNSKFNSNLASYPYYWDYFLQKIKSLSSIIKKLNPGM